eukprot:scaffold81724_cov73-Phaeocystis_antarctica.AAC.1
MPGKATPEYAQTGKPKQAFTPVQQRAVFEERIQLEVRGLPWDCPPAFAEPPRVELAFPALQGAEQAAADAQPDSGDAHPRQHDARRRACRRVHPGDGRGERAESTAAANEQPHLWLLRAPASCGDGDGLTAVLRDQPPLGDAGEYDQPTELLLQGAHGRAAAEDPRGAQGAHAPGDASGDSRACEKEHRGSS